MGGTVEDLGVVDLDGVEGNIPHLVPGSFGVYPRREVAVVSIPVP